MKRLILDAHDRQSATWVKVKDHLEAKLQEAREKNDVVQPEDRTAKLRGEIGLLKELLAADKPPPGVK